MKDENNVKKDSTYLKCQRQNVFSEKVLGKFSFGVIGHEKFGYEKRLGINENPLSHHFSNSNLKIRNFRLKQFSVNIFK